MAEIQIADVELGFIKFGLEIIADILQEVPAERQVRSAHVCVVLPAIFHSQTRRIDRFKTAIKTNTGS